MYRFTISFENEDKAHEIISDIRSYMVEYVAFSDTIPVYKDGVYHYTVDCAIDDNENAKIFANYATLISDEHSPKYSAVKYQYFPFLPAKSYLNADNIKFNDINSPSLLVNRIDFAFTIDNPHTAWEAYEGMLDVIESSFGHHIYDASNLMYAQKREQRNAPVYYEGYIDTIASFTIDNLDEFNTISQKISEILPEHLFIGTKRISDL